MMETNHPPLDGRANTSFCWLASLFGNNIYLGASVAVFKQNESTPDTYCKYFVMICGIGYTVSMGDMYTYYTDMKYSYTYTPSTYIYIRYNRP